MTAIFIPIEQTWSEAGCLIAVGSAHLDAAGDPSEEQLGLAEMASAEFAGLVEVTLSGGQVQLVARVVDQVAAEKCRKSVYSGFSLVAMHASDGSTRVRRVSLVDSPSGFSKTLLKISKGSNMQKAPSILCSAPEVALMVHQARARLAEQQRLSKANALPCPPTAAGMAQHNALSTSSAGRGTDKAPYGEGLAGAADCMAAIRRMLAQPYRESCGLITLLAGRHA